MRGTDPGSSGGNGGAPDQSIPDQGNGDRGNSGIGESAEALTFTRSLTASDSEESADAQDDAAPA